MPVYSAEVRDFLKVSPFKRLDTTASDRLRGLALHVRSNVDSADALSFLDFALVRFLGRLGGALPLIVFDRLRGDDSKQLLEDAGNDPLTDAELDRCLGVLEGVEIYVTGRKPPMSDPSRSSTEELDGRVFWTLTDDQFSNGETVTRDQPDVSKAVVVIYVSGFNDLLEMYPRDSAVGNLKVDLQREEAIVGRARVVAHEGTHAMRMHASILEHQDELAWTRNACGDWCLDVEVFKDMIATPAKLAGHVTGQKLDYPNFPADSGRVLEHSITGGKAIFERDLNVVVVLRKTASTAGQPDEQILSRCLGADDLRAVFRDPFALRAISRRM